MYPLPVLEILSFIKEKSQHPTTWKKLRAYVREKKQTLRPNAVDPAEMKNRKDQIHRDEREPATWVQGWWTKS